MPKEKTFKVEDFRINGKTTIKRKTFDGHDNTNPELKRINSLIGKKRLFPEPGDIVACKQFMQQYENPTLKNFIQKHNLCFHTIAFEKGTKFIFLESPEKLLSPIKNIDLVDDLQPGCLLCIDEGTDFGDREIYYKKYYFQFSSRIHQNFFNYFDCITFDCKSSNKRTTITT
jgi:hypothetical protein